MDQNTVASCQPVTKALAGYSNAESQAMFENYAYATALIGGDISLFTSTRRHPSFILRSCLHAGHRPLSQVY